MPRRPSDRPRRRAAEGWAVRKSAFALTPGAGAGAAGREQARLAGDSASDMRGEQAAGLRVAERLIEASLWREVSDGTP